MYNSDLSIYEVSVGGMSTVVRMSNNFNIIHLTLSKMVIRPVDGFKAIHRRRVRQSKQMSLATNTRASCSPSQSKCCQKPRAASAKCRVFPVYLIIFSPKRKDILSVSLQFSHQLFSIIPTRNKEMDPEFFCSCLIISSLKKKIYVSAFSRNKSEKPTKQSISLQAKTHSCLQGRAMIDEGDYLFYKQVFISS